MFPCLASRLPVLRVVSLGIVSYLFGSGTVLGQLAEPTGETPNQGAAAAPAEPLRPRLGRTGGGLPATQGQIWKEYDLRDYTSQVSSTARPEQAVIDWILRETGTEVWFSEPVGLLNANRDTLSVYHTPEMHELIQKLVDRFIASQGEPYALGVRLMTVNNPSWRGKALPLMQSVTVQSPGVDAWLLTKEDAAMLLADLRARADFKEHTAPVLAIPAGQSQGITRLWPRNYIRTVRLTDSAIGYELEATQIQEGYSLQFSPLMVEDDETMDLVIKCQIDQVENLLPVAVEVPGAGRSRQTVRIEVPQLVSWRLHERFRWPSDQVLLLSCGVVASPSETPTTSRPIPMLLGSPKERADALLFIEYQGPATQAVIEAARTATRRDGANRGRY